MNIEIIGVGKLGSTVAFVLLPIADKIILTDIKDLSGELLDLKHAAKGLGLTTEITLTKEKNPDYVILCAGRPRMDEKDILDDNYITIVPILEDLTNRISPDTTVVVMTNPVEKMTKFVSEILKCKVVNPEEELMKIRDNKELGWEIVKSKGYSNWGPSVSVLNLIENQLETRC